MNSIVNLKDGFITFNSNIDHSLSFSKCAIGYSNYSINSHERGALVFLTNNNANTANVSMHSDIRMCIASDGNIGIGTNNPSQKLDIAGNTNISRILKIGGINQNDDEIKLQVYASSNNIIAIFKHPNDSQGIGISYDSVFALGSDTNATQPISIKSKGNTNVVLNTNSIDRLTVFGNGNVGIGTNNANSRLHLHNTTANSDVGIRFSDFTSGAGATQGFAIGENSTQQAYLLNYGNTDMLFSTNNAERLRILANGNVGIGTATPETILDINGNLLIRAYAGTSGTNGIFFRPGFATTNQYNCSILTFDHSSGGANDGISINGFQGVSFCTGANTRQERMRIDGGGNVGIGTTNPAYRTHIKCVYDDISKGLHLDASDAVPTAPNQYALTIYPYIVGAGQVGWKFRSQSHTGGTNTPLTFDHAGNVILGGTISGNGSLLTSINAANISSGTINSLRLPTATTSVLGGVKVDGTTITINSSTGVISGANTYVLPTASTSVLGGVKVDGTIHTIINDTLKIIEPTSYLMQDVETNARMYPPIRNFTGASGTTIAVSGQQYGNGNYTIHYTSEQVDYYRPTTVFNEIEDRGGIWGANNYTNGVYNKTLSIVNDTSYPGDGVKIQFPVSIRLTSYILKNSYDIATAPKDFRIYGSINGTTWDILDQRANITHMDVSATFGKFAHIYEQDVNTYNYYSHFAITVNKNNGRDFIHIDEWYIYGREAIPSQYNYKKNSIIKYVAGNQNDINFRNTGSWQISDDILPATNNVLGGVKGGGNISIATDGTISAIGYKIKNINADNISTGTINSLRLPVATASDIGGVKKGNNINIAGDGTISVDLLSYNGNSTINGDLVVNSNLIIHGTSTTLNTDVYTTERLEITNGGINSSLTIKQTVSGNTNNILNVINSATSNVFNVSSAGNVGIGTTNPINRLHLHNTTANSDVSIRFTDTTSGAGATQGFAIGENTTQQAYLWNYGNTDMLFATNNAERLRILANGNVGIGTNSALSSLHLHKNAITQDVRIILSDNTSTSAALRGFHIGKYVDNTSFIYNFENTALYFATNGTERLRIAANGNIGIGTNADIQSKLTINGINTNVANSFDHSEAPLTITNPTATSISVLNDPKAVLNLCRTGTTGQAYSTRACFKLCRYENDSVNSRTRLDITLAHNYYDELNIMSLQSGGNVGIGTTNPVSRLHLHNTTANSDVAIRFTDSTSGAGATNGFVIGENSTQKAYLWNYGNTDMLFATNNAERMTISNAGNVGIGTISPNANLHLHGNAASQNVRISFSDNTSGIATTDGFCIGKDSLQKAYIYNCENADIDFGTSNTERMRIMANGNIGIGTNSSLSSLHLHKNALAQDVRIILSDNTSTSSTTRGLHLIKGTDNIGYLWNYENTPLILATNNAERMRIAENGNVGIGTTPAIHFFHLHMNNTTDVLRLCFTNNNTTTAANRGFVMGIHSNRDTFLWNNENTSLVFGTNNIGRIIILANGNVGIGTETGIGEKLVVSGNAQITGTISGNGSLLTNINATNISSGTIDSLRLPIAGSGAGGILGGVKVDGTTITINASGIITSVGGGGSSQWTTSGINIYNANTGNVGIGTNDPAIYKCQVNGNLGATGNITAYYSDERLKNITEYVSDVLPALDKINVFKYNCNDLAESFGYDKSKKEIGLSAQEIQKFYPEIVSIAPFDADCDKETNKIISKSGENYLTLDYERLVPVLLQAIKELNHKYTALEDKYNKIMPT
jgi:phage FluMu protein gp41